jgi:integrase/recombinase XerD
VDSVKLCNGIEVYVENKRAGGLLFKKGASNLQGLCRQIGDVPLISVRTSHVLAFLNGPHTSTVTWRGKYNLLKHFFDYWVARGEMPPVLMPPSRPPIRQTFIPHIYTREEIRDLLNANRHYRTQFLCTIDPQTMRTLLLLLYGTGAYMGEILQLSAGDIDLKTGYIVIRNRRFSRMRRIPVGPDLQFILGQYVSWKRRRGLTGDHFLQRKDGQPLVARTVANHFQRLRLSAGVNRHDQATYQPRLHDLRATFAVHRITSWIKSGADINRMIPALSAYMGQVGLASTERFFFLTPERFRKELNKLSPRRGKRHWRDNPSLMGFLENLAGSDRSKKVPTNRRINR